MKVTMCRVNGKTTYVDDLGRTRVCREVLERNVLDMLEDNDLYGNLDFCDAEDVCYKATDYELIMIYAEKLDPAKIDEIINRTEYVNH